jgi:NADPH2:quinone reductase
MMLALATQYCTAYYASHVVTTVMPGDVVLQHAVAGGVGTALVQLCKHRGATVIGLTSSEGKMNQALQNGCDIAINYTTTDYVAEVRKKVGKIDVSFNSVAGSTFKKDLGLLNKGGRLVCYGAAERLSGKWGFFSTLGLVLRMGRIVPVKLLMQSQSLIGVNMLRIADHRPDILQHCMEAVVEMYRQNKVHPLVGATYPVERIAEAHDFFESGKSTGKLVVKW